MMCEMTNGKAQGKTKHVKRVPNSQSAASVGTNGVIKAMEVSKKLTQITYMKEVFWATNVKTR